MSRPFTEDEATLLRDLIIRQETPSDVDLSQLGDRPVAEYRAAVQRWLAQIVDPQITLAELVALLNQPPTPLQRSPRHAPPPIQPPQTLRSEPIVSAGPIALPPKFRGKSMPKTPTAPMPAQGSFVAAPQLISIPILPRFASSPATVTRPRASRMSPHVGSLAAVLHPSLGPAHVCRVLGKCIQNENECFLVAFFQPEYSPCYVPSDYLFQLQPHIGFPLCDEEEGEFQRVLAEDNICIDWLLERIFSSAQNLAISLAETFFPPDRLQSAGVKPNQEQIQQFMFQCVSCAALLIVCYVTGKWKIPEEKSKLIITTILKTSPVKFVSTQAIMARAETYLGTLVSIKD
jgi:hypothetical protein